MKDPIFVFSYASGSMIVILILIGCDIHGRNNRSQACFRCYGAPIMIVLFFR